MRLLLAALMFAPSLAAQAPDSGTVIVTVRESMGPVNGALVRAAGRRATTDALGRFSVTVARSLFRGTGEESLGQRAYTDLGGGRMSTSYQVSIVKFDPKTDRVDAGRVVLQPLKPKGAAR